MAIDWGFHNRILWRHFDGYVTRVPVHPSSGKIRYGDPIRLEDGMAKAMSGDIRGVLFPYRLDAVSLGWVERNREDGERELQFNRLLVAVPQRDSILLIGRTLISYGGGQRYPAQWDEIFIGRDFVFQYGGLTPEWNVICVRPYIAEDTFAHGKIVLPLPHGRAIVRAYREPYAGTDYI